MKPILFTTAILMVLCIQASATTVEVFADQTNLTLGDSVKLNLHVVPEDTRGVGGQLQVSREVEPKKYRLLTIFVDYPSPSQCAECAGKVPLQSEKNSTYTFTPSDPGLYLVEANFGHARDNLYLNVSEPVTTTHPQSTTTILNNTTTSPKVTSTTLNLTSTTTIVQTSSSTFAGQQVSTTLLAGQGIISGGLVLVVGLLAVLLLAFFVAFKKS